MRTPRENEDHEDGPARHDRREEDGGGRKSGHPDRGGEECWHVQT